MFRSFRTWIAIWIVATGFGIAQAQSFVNFETPHCHPIDLSPDGATLATCNTPANRVDLWDMSSGTPVFVSGVPVGYDPVSVRWRTNTEVWVVNHISDTVSIVNASTLAVNATIETLDEPCDVVFAGSTPTAFVSCSSENFIQLFNPTTHAETGQVEIRAEDPRALTVSADGTKVYAAVFESGNGTTILFGAFTSFNAINDPTGPYRGQNPPPNVDVAGFNTNLIDWDTDWSAEAANYFSPAPRADTIATRPPNVSLIVRDDGTGTWLDDNGVDWTSWVTGANAATSGRFTGWSLVDRDIAIIDANDPTGVAVQYVERLMNHNMAIGVNPVSGDITVVGIDGTNLIRFEPNLTGTFIRVNLALIDPADIVNGKTIVDLNEAHLDAAQSGPGTAYQDGNVLQADRDKSIGDPRAIVWNAAGDRGFIAGMGSNNLVTVDANGDRTVLGETVELQEGPTGLAIDDTRQQLYALNRFDASISVLDISGAKAASFVATVPFFDPTPTETKIGRVHLYGTHENSGLGQIACASCHVDGRHDRLAWDLGDPSADIKALNLITNSGELGNQHNPLFLPVTLNDFHGMKGPMTTQTLRDIIGKEPLHWRGDRDGLEEFAGAFVGLQGADAQLVGAPMQEFEDHLATLHFPPNEFRNLDNSLPINVPLPRQFATGRFSGVAPFLNEGDPLPNGNAQNGLTIYRRDNMDGSVSCATCHTLPIGNSTDLFFDGALHVPLVGPNGEKKLALFDADGSDDRVMKVPQTRAIFDKQGMDISGGGESLAGFGLFHDGASPSIADFVSSTVFSVVSDQEVADLVALNFSFSGSFDVTPIAGEFPITQVSRDAHAAVGKQVTFNSSSKDLTLLNNLVLEADTADVFQVDLIAKTNSTASGIGPVVRGWRYDAGTNLFVSDRADESGITQAALLAMAAPGTEITFTATPLGAGVRLGTDRDEDGLSDFDEVRDLDLTVPGVQNPFDPDDSDSTGDNGLIGPDGTPDGQNDFDNDGTDNETELLTVGGTPLGDSIFAGLPAFQAWGLLITVLLMAGALAGAVAIRRRVS